MNKVLILGGTNFIGRRLVEFLIENTTHELTLFNRGKTNAGLFPNCRVILGDRHNGKDLDQLFLEAWDYIIDLSCYFPGSLKIISEKIDRNLSKYIFISTCSVYDQTRFEGIFRNENSPLLKCNETEESDTSLDTYGKRKAACEKVLNESNLPFVILRPALVYGPYDNTDRLYYWLKAVQSEHEFLLPENGERLFSLTYVDDLVHCIVQSMDSTLKQEVYNCISHPSISIAQIVELSSSLMKLKANSISVDADFLKKENVSQWFDLPLWLNTDKFTFSNQKISEDFDFIPTDIEQCLEETIAFYQLKDFPEPISGMKLKRKKELLQKYRSNG